MKTVALSLFIIFCTYLSGHAQTTVLALADTARYNLHLADLNTRYVPQDTLLKGLSADQRRAFISASQQLDRERGASVARQGPMPGYGFYYQLSVYVRANGQAEWVLVRPHGVVPPKLLSELVNRLTVFYQQTPLAITSSRPFRQQLGSAYGRPIASEKRQLRTGDSTIVTLAAAQATTRPDTVKYLHFNQLLLEQVPEVVYRFPNLEELDLSKNQLTQLPLRLTRDVPSLRRLSLLFNQIGDDSVFIAPKSMLRALTLQGNNLTRMPAAVAHCRQLESLWMGNNQLVELNIKPLRRLRNLADLNLYNAGLTRLPRQVKKLKHVVVFDLYYNQLTELPRQLGKMRRLEQLAVANNKLQSLPRQLGRLRQLRALFVHHNALNQLPDSFAKLRSLQLLDLGYNQFSSIPNALLNLTALESVDISNNNIQTLPANLTGLRNLKKFYIRSNPLTQNDAKAGPYAQLIEAMETNKTEVFY